MKLPKWLQDLVINVLLPLAKVAGKQKVVEYLEQLKSSEPNWYATTIIVAYRMLVVHLKPLSDDTSTPYDNEAVDLVIAAIIQSASANNIKLPDVTIIPKPLPPTS